LLNHVARELTGWGDDAVGEPLANVFVIVNELTRLPVESPVERVLREGNVVGVANHLILRARDGRNCPSMTPAPRSAMPTAVSPASWWCSAT